MTTSPFSTPKKHYAAQVSHNGCISFPIPKNSPSKKVRNILYDIYNTQADPETGEVNKTHYFGLTTNFPDVRWGQHGSAAKTGKCEDPFHMDLAASPHQFSAAIVKICSSPEELAEAECTLIENAKKTHAVYNQRNGGGGLRKKKEKDENAPPPTIYETPEKYYPIERNKKGNLQAKWTPNGKNAENGVYVIKNQKTDERYIGGSVKPDKRLSVHLHFANNSDGSHLLYEDLHSSPDKTFSVGLLAKDLDPVNLDFEERRFIELKNSQKHGYNQNRGGGGLAKH